MPAIFGQGALMELERREWKNTVGQSGMTPTAFAFLIPVFVVVVFCPVLCIFCVRKRQRGVPARVPTVKKPALRRAEARERLNLVTSISQVTTDEKAPCDGTIDEPEQAPVAETSSISERECAICLSTLHAPSPPEPALVTSQPTVDEAATRPTTPDNTKPTEPEPILKLQACGHEFHAECLVSWFVLRKTTCPICRSVYITKEDMDAFEDEEAAIGMQQMTLENGTAPPGAPPTTAASRVTNWRYFWNGESVWSRPGVAAQTARPAQTAQAAQTAETVQPATPAQQPRLAFWRRGDR